VGSQILIFSLLKIRKKTAAALAGIAIAFLCLWGLSMWQDISLGEMLQVLLSTIIMLVAIILSALTLIAIVKGVSKGARTIFHRTPKSKE
tara:strand:- start:172 stop:441 length:270 start_codon:yes stop_codon:yes gene_type:complete